MKRKKPIISQQTPGMWAATTKSHYFSKRLRSEARWPPVAAREPRGAPGCGAGGAPRAVLCRSVTNRDEPCRVEPCRAEPSRAEPFSPPGPGADKAAANCRRLGFGGPLCTRLAFPSDRTAAKFDFVHSEGSLDLFSLPVCKWYAAGPFAITFKMHPRHRLSGERWPLPQPGWKLVFKVPRWNFQVRDAGLDQIT